MTSESLSSYTIHQEAEMPEILSQKRLNIPESHSSSIRRRAIPSQTVRNSILRTEIQNAGSVEADAYRPCGAAAAAAIASNNSNIRLPLPVKPLHQHQLKPENPFISGELRCSNAKFSSLPRMSKTTLQSSKALCKTLSDDLRQNSQTISSDDTSKSQCEFEISMEKSLHGIDLNLPINDTMTCIARPIYCDNEMMMTRGSYDIKSPLQKAVTVRRTTETERSFPSTNISNVSLASDNLENSAVDIKWEVSECNNSKRELKCGTLGSPTKSMLKVIRPRRLTVACATVNDTTPERSGITRKNIIGTDSLKRKTTRESPKKPWFSSSVDGPPVVSQIRETGIDDDLPCKRIVAPKRFHPRNSSLSVPVQKPTILKSDSSQLHRISATPPPKPTRTYEEALVDLMQPEKSDIKFVRKTCPVMGSSRIVVPKDYYRNSGDHSSSSDSGFGANFRENSNEASPNVQTLGKWLQALDLPCDSYCLGNEDLMLSENSLIRFLF